MVPGRHLRFARHLGNNSGIGTVQCMLSKSSASNEKTTTQLFSNRILYIKVIYVKYISPRRTFNFLFSFSPNIHNLSWQCSPSRCKISMVQTNRVRSQGILLQLLSHLNGLSTVYLRHSTPCSTYELLTVFFCKSLSPPDHCRKSGSFVCSFSHHSFDGTCLTRRQIKAHWQILLIQEAILTFCKYSNNYIGKVDSK
jgi:hypothetical protein